MYNYSEVEKKERRKIISVAIAIVVLILVLLVAIIVVATKKDSGETLSEGENTEFVIEEGIKEEVEEEKTENETGESTLGSISTETVEIPVLDEMPTTITQTGPEDILPMALLLGILTTVGTAAYMKKNAK